MRVGVASARASGSGLAIARFFGYSSPKIIVTIVASSSAPVVPISTEAVVLSPAPPSSVPMDSPMSGSATYPMSRPVTVMPSCAPDNMNDVRFVMSSTR